MEFHLLPMLVFLSLALAVSHATLPSQVYWHSVLPNTPMPKAVRDLLYPGLTDQQSTSVDVGKGGVNVDTGKGNSGTGTGADEGHEGGDVGTSKPQDGTNVGVGKGGVAVITGNKVNVGVTPGPNPFNYVYAASEDQLHHDPNVALFFLEKDLHTDKKMNLHFIRTTPGATLLSRKVADSIPFSSKALPEILNKFSIDSNSVKIHESKF